MNANERCEYAWRRREEGLTWREIGVELGVTGEAARQMHWRYIDHLAQSAIRERAHAYEQQVYEASRRRWLQRRRRVETLISVADWFIERGGSEAFDQFGRTLR